MHPLFFIFIRIAALCAVIFAPLCGLAQERAACDKPLYLTFDTGSQSQAESIAHILRKHQVKATFFMANEKTVQGDFSLAASWAPYWRARVAEGHAFGTHTFDHVYLAPAHRGKKNLDATFAARAQFGEAAGKTLTWTPAQYCAELKRVETRFGELTGGKLDALWRAPGGYTSSSTLAAGKACGYQHVGWSPAGFLGDELSSETHPNAMLLQRALHNIKKGDVLMMHLGIWSRKDPFAPMLDPLIAGLKQKGFCFATLRAHPHFQSAQLTLE